jgi:hypothetical protein
MIIRMYALYGRSIYVLSFLMVLWVTQIIISSVGLSTGHGECFFNSSTSDMIVLNSLQLASCSVTSGTYWYAISTHKPNT